MGTNNLPKLILGSSSPQRRDLLTEAGYEFEVVPPHLPEPTDLPASLSPTEHAQRLAHFKANCVAESCPDECVLGADTVVAVNGKIIGKAADANEAVEMLTELSGTPHKVITGIALIGPGGSRPHFHERAEENYRVVEGSVPLAVRLGEKGQVLRGEDEFGVRIPCNLVHNAAGVGGWARVEVRCHPVWSKDDHFEV